MPAFSLISLAELRNADRFADELIGRRRSRRGSGELVESSAVRRPLIDGPLSDSEWRSVVLMLSRGEAEVGAPFTTDPTRNARLVAAAIFCSRNALLLEREDPLLCLTSEVTTADRRVQALVPHVTARGPIVDWTRYPRASRVVHAMTLLTTVHAYSVNAAAGLVGNLIAESGVMPQRLEGSSEATPLRAPAFDGSTRTFTADDVIRRNAAARTGPRLPGVGLAQWTSGARRSNLFTHAFRGVTLGPRVLFDFDAQVDYLVTELRTSFPAVQRVLTTAGVTVDDASDEVVYQFEVPGAILAGSARLPRTHAQVVAVFRARRALAAEAARAFAATRP